MDVSQTVMISICSTDLLTAFIAPLEKGGKVENVVRGIRVRKGLKVCSIVSRSTSFSLIPFLSRTFPLWTPTTTNYSFVIMGRCQCMLEEVACNTCTSISIQVNKMHMLHIGSKVSHIGVNLTISNVQNGTLNN